MERRNFLGLIPAAALLSSFKAESKLPISCSTYDWLTFFKREGKVWGENVAEDIAEFKKTGLKAIEPNLSSVEMAKDLIAVLQKERISMPSVYIGCKLHEQAELEAELKRVLAIVDVVKGYGTQIIVTNPNPINWGGGKLKTDEQLVVQARALNELGAEIRAKGLKLAYHTHDMEMKAGAREFHHMLQNTEAQNMSFCFDVHWIYRGAENSEIAVFDVLQMYGNRISELHLRQSKNGIYEEVFTADGDIDYPRFAQELLKMKVFPHLVIEQCLEENSPNTMNALTAHKADLKAVEEVFKGII